MQKLVPDDPLLFIRQRIVERKIFWTYHVNMRMKGRHISREEILNSVNNFEIIESYPDDKYLPSHLIYSEHQNRKFHVHIATDVVGDNVRIITSYVPNLMLWEDDFRTRRKRQ